ncbi:hypothetical protein AVEN_82750-1 [Araneus ventricosus]|uniref:Uncharacterized protein n=1 Tax=Araneus ventricosus TaxID=182803 RepID=A0A4Y2E936_ARAVE|nr:hypothetical protein AVEN_82750-1 [Araneus ventricosus]
MEAWSRATRRHCSGLVQIQKIFLLEESIIPTEADEKSFPGCSTEDSWEEAIALLEWTLRESNEWLSCADLSFQCRSLRKEKEGNDAMSQISRHSWRIAIVICSVSRIIN